jgi:hypothetical protein
MSKEIQINWNVTALECFSNLSGYSDVVYNVHWDCLGYYSGVSGESNSRTYSVTSLDAPDITGDFTPYSSLTPNQVLGWTWDKLGAEQKAKVEEETAQLVVDKISPRVVIPALPWA